MYNISIIIILLLFVLCPGCTDFAVKQQKAEEARRAQTAKDLKKLGLQMHSRQTTDSASGPVAAQEDAADSNGRSSNKPATPDQPETVDDSGNVLAPVE